LLSINGGILLHTTGVVAHRRGDLPQAKALCEEALDYLEKTDSNVEIANVLFDLAPVDIKLGQAEEAKAKLARAADIYRKLGMQLRAQEASALIESSSDLEHG